MSAGADGHKATAGIFLDWYKVMLKKCDFVVK